MLQNQEDPWRNVRRYLWMLAFITLWAGAYLLSRGTEFLAGARTVDDTYYYLQIAWNHQRLGFPTFDGLVPTNGVQALWYVWLRGLAAVFLSKDALLAAAFGSSVLCHFFAFFFIYRIGRTIDSPAFAAVAGALWLIYGGSTRMPWSGMENALHALTIWWVIDVSLRLKALEGWPFAEFCLALTLMTWVRLDSAVPALVLLGVAVWRERTTWQWRAVAPGLLIGVAGAVIYLFTMRSWGGTWIPLSGSVKQSGIFPFVQLSPLIKAKNIFTGIWPIFLWPSFTAIFLAAAGVSAWFHREHLRQFAPLAWATGAYLLFMLVFPTTAFQRWYFSLPMILVIAGIAAVVPQKAMWSMAWIGFQIGFVGALNGPAITMDEESIFTVRYRFARWIEANTAPDERLASWNAGQLGYFTNRTVINLDGLVNDREYFEKVFKPQRGLMEYLREKKVRYVIDYRDQSPGKLISGLPEQPAGNFSYLDEEGKRRTFKMWKVIE